MIFCINGIHWRIVYVSPESTSLIDRTGRRTVATTDPRAHKISVANNINGAFKIRVLMHELAHCIMISYGMLDYIHSMVKEPYWIEMEEMICNLIADHGLEIFKIAQEIF